MCNNMFDCLSEGSEEKEIALLAILMMMKKKLWIILEVVL